MSDEARAKEVFLDALELPLEERERFVRGECGPDAALRARVERLLAAHALADLRLSRPLEPGLAPGSTVGPYRLIEPLGEGGFGVVWRARQETPVRRDVALKILRADARGGAGLARFELERQALAALTHPGIARVYEGGTERGWPWFAMELVDGVEITAWVERAGAGVRQRLGLFLDVCRAIQHAHQRGVIHRDVKPSNVMVGETDGRPQVKVIDFGIAQVDAELAGDWTRRTLTGQVLGTPAYMSPEQLVDTRDVDTRSDVYSLGVLLYELLVGAPPFDPAWLRAKGPSDALTALREQDPPRPSARARGLAGKRTARVRELEGDLDWIVMRAMEKDRERRYAAVAQLAADVERFLRGEPVLAGPPSRLYRARKFARRHALALGALAAIAVALLAGTAWATLEMRRARRAELAEAEAAAHARLESESFQSIAEFLEHVLLSIDPAVAQGRDVSLLREVLDRAATGIADRGDRPPLVEAALRRVIGGAYASLAEYDASVEQLERALALRRGELGPDDPASILSESELASVLLHGGQLARSRELYADCLERARRVLGPDDEGTLQVLGNHAALLQALGESAEAVALLEELEERMIRTQGRENEHTLVVTNNLALALMDVGRLDEGAERLRFLMEVQVERLTERHPRALAAMGNYATALGHLGRMQEAEALIRRALALKLEILDPAHPSVIVSRNNLASLLEETGRPDEAIALYEQALEGARPGTDQEAKLLLNLSDGLRRAGRAGEAADRAMQAREAAVAGTGERSELTRACDARLAEALLELGVPEEALAPARRAWEAWADDDSADPVERANARLRLGVVLAALGEAVEAREHLERGLAETPPSSEWRPRATASLAALGE